jgi:hypothetical protein
MKRHGFCMPLHWAQVGSWALVALLAAEFFVFTAPNLQDAYRKACTGTYITSLALTTLLCFLCTKADPTDEAVKLAQKGLQPSEPKRFPKLCVRCATHVETHSKHCSVCERCTADFDHHCNWVNNCVGRGNYQWFLLLILVLEVCMCVQTVSTAGVLRETFESTKVRERYDVGERAVLFQIALILTILVAGGIAAANGCLILFHCYLCWKHLTTYDFIIRRRQMRKVTPAYSETPGNATGLQASNCAMEPEIASGLAESTTKPVSLAVIPMLSKSLETPTFRHGNQPIRACKTVEEFFEERGLSAAVSIE